MLLVVSLLHTVVLPGVLCANSTGGYWAIELPGALNVSNVNLSGLNITQLGTDIKPDVVPIPKKLPGNSTDTGSSGSSDGLSWWAWAMIATGGVFLVVILILVAVFYADIKKYMGYEQLPKTGVGNMGLEAANRKIIEVALVHPACMGGALGSSQSAV